MNREIIITDRVEGLHCWPNAPGSVAFLRSSHRHLFLFRVGIQVTAADRQREFFLEKGSLQAAIQSISGVSTPAGLVDFGVRSCEHLAEAVLTWMGHASWVEVFEDGENGVRVTRENSDH